MRRTNILMSMWWVLLMGMGSLDCDCGGSTPPSCETDADCDTTAGECCRSESCTSDCELPCDTTTCTRNEDCADLGVCMECTGDCCRSYACESDDDCPAEGGFQRFCSPEPDPDEGCRICEYVRCDTDADCTDPAHPLYIDSCPESRLPKCRNGVCECAHPCGGDCPDEQYCCLSNRQCEPVPDPCPSVNCPECQQVNPEPGGVLDEQACEVTGADCSCVPMPALEDAFSGQHSAIALGADGIPVLSGYFGQPYGDLLFGVASSAEAGAMVTWTFIDGVDTDAPCTGAADGPRGGIAEPGDDVGWDTDILVDLDGNPRISYFDRSNGDLKYAAFDGAAWTIHVVDSAGITGRFSSLILDFAGRPAIAYMTTRENRTSYLKVARANIEAPTSDLDWTLHVVDAAPIACQPSDCPDGQACVLQTGNCELVDDPANCREGSGCLDGYVCIAGTCSEEAVETSLEALPPGVGLYANLALYADNSPAVAYYDNSRGNLMFAWWNPGTAAFDPPVILAGEDGAGNDLGNLGADVDMVIALPADTVHMAYQDFDLGDVYYMTFTGKQVGSAVVELVDLGARDADGNPTDVASAVGGLHWVGNFASTLVDLSGTVRVAYQDGTSLDLVYALRQPAGAWSIEIAARRQSGDDFDGNYGFFVDQVLDQAGAQAIISNFKHNLRTDPWSSEIDIRTR